MKLIDRMLIPYILSLVLLFGGSNAFTFQEKSKNDWKFVGELTHESMYELYYNTSSIKRTPLGTLKVGLKQVPVYENEQERDKIRSRVIDNRKLNGFRLKGYDKYAYSTMLVEFNCKTKEGRTLSIEDYDEDGKVIGKQDSRILEWAPVASGSTIIKVFEAACGER